jgi:hypothetical protein
MVDAWGVVPTRSEIEGEEYLFDRTWNTQYLDWQFGEDEPEMADS